MIEWEIQESRPRGLLKPRRLSSGDVVAVFTPSMPFPAFYEGRFHASVAGLARSMNVHVHTPSQAVLSTGFTAGGREVRAATLQALIANEKIRAIFCSIGGYNSAELLPYLDPHVLRENPKVLVGQSDCTALLLGIQAIAGWITFHGPTIMPQFGEFPEPMEYTVASLRRLICDATGTVEWTDPPGWTDEFLDWGTDAWRERARIVHSPAHREVWRAGRGQGYLFGGNIETLNFLAGTRFLCPPDDVVLFLEATAEEAFLPRVRRALTHLDQIGLLRKTRALLLGRCPDARPLHGVDLRETVLESVSSYTFPVIGSLAFGHTDPTCTIPVGGLCDVAATAEGCDLRLLESAVL